MRRIVFALSFTLCAAGAAQEIAKPGATGLPSDVAAVTSKSVPKMTKREDVNAIRKQAGGVPASQERSHIGDFPPYGLRKPRPAIGPSDLQR